LLDEALRMVREEGGDALTLQALGARMGLSKPALYYYWKSKDELLDAVVLDVLTRETHDVMSAIDQAPDGVAAVAAAARARVHHHARDLHGFRMLHALATRTVAPTTLLAVYGLSARVNGALEKRLKEDRAAGLLDDHVKPRVLANLSWVVAEGVLSVASLMDAAGGNTRHSIDELIEHACETLVRGARLTSHKPAPGKVAKSARKARVTTSTST
jgi:AcrR family transcriptional regulator